jgi:hypothetical protein
MSIPDQGTVSFIAEIDKSPLGHPKLRLSTRIKLE